jgi:hypothetical protein
LRTRIPDRSGRVARADAFGRQPPPSQALQGDLALASGRSPSSRIVQGQSSGTDFLRLVGSMEGLLPATALDSLTPEQLRTVQEALEQYRRMVEARLADVLYAQPGTTPSRQRLAEVSKAARDEVEQTLRTTIRDDAVVGQLTTAVVRFG